MPHSSPTGARNQPTGGMTPVSWFRLSTGRLGHDMSIGAVRPGSDTTRQPASQPAGPARGHGSGTPARDGSSRPAGTVTGLLHGGTHSRADRISAGQPALAAAEGGLSLGLSRKICEQTP